jgi:hypothetical protein
MMHLSSVYSADSRSARPLNLPKFLQLPFSFGIQHHETQALLQSAPPALYFEVTLKFIMQGERGS